MLSIVKYLLQEIEDELEYNDNYAEAKKIAWQKSAEEEERTGRSYISYYDYMPEEFKRSPRESIIEQNAITIRRLLLKLYKNKNCRSW